MAFSQFLIGSFFTIADRVDLMPRAPDRSRRIREMELRDSTRLRRGGGVSTRHAASVPRNIHDMAYEKEVYNARTTLV